VSVDGAAWEYNRHCSASDENEICWGEQFSATPIKTVHPGQLRRSDQYMSLGAPRWFIALEKAATQNPNSSCECSGVTKSLVEMSSLQLLSQCFN
jgi:hypothetical protein